MSNSDVDYSAEQDERIDAAEPEEGSEPEAENEGASGKKRRPRRRRKETGAEPRNDREAQALEFLTAVVANMNMDCDVTLSAPKEDSPDDIQLEISGVDAGRIIGKKGQVLAALQFICNRVVNRPGLDRRYVTVDAEGYRSRRDDSLATMAQRLGKQAVEHGKIITFEPMSPRDRRVVHLALTKLEGVVTRSEGEGEDRRVQIIPVRR